MQTRIYIVEHDNHARLVRAANKAQAIRHVAKDTFKVEVASQNDLVVMLETGTKVESAESVDEVQS